MTFQVQIRLENGIKFIELAFCFLNCKSVGLTDNHQGELEALLDGLAMHLVGQIRKADIAWRLQAGKLQIERVFSE